MSRSGGETDGLSVGPPQGDAPPKRRPFVIGTTGDVALRVAIGRSAQAEIQAHAKSQLDAEICGVLVGDVFQDERGPHVSVDAVIPGRQARAGGAHVTFTQETWDDIHRSLARDHPTSRLVGWYHSHPGFGVQFSEMDVFIQRHFFSAPTQVALVIDPIGGEVAMCCNGTDGPVAIDRYWVDGREIRCTARHADRGVATANTDALAEAIGALDVRLAHFIQEIDEQKNRVTSWLITGAMVALIAIVAWIGLGIYRFYFGDPLEIAVDRLRTIPIEVDLGGRHVILTTQVLAITDVPPPQGQPPPAAQGQPSASQGQPPAAQGPPPAAQGQPPSAQGQPPAAQGPPPAPQGPPPPPQGQPSASQGQSPTSADAARPAAASNDEHPPATAAAAGKDTR